MLPPRTSARNPRFPEGATRFLRALKRHNDRAWFRARREEFDRLIDRPMNELIERLAVDFRSFAPEFVASPRLSRYRIYRDTRFSEDKRPLKTHISAIFPARGLPRHEGPALYFEIAGGWVYAGGGLYHPEPDVLQAVRAYLAAHDARFRRIVAGKPFRAMFGELEGDRLTRVPRGYAADHPAADLLKYRQMLAGREWPAAFASSPRFYGELLKTFRVMAPVVRFLNEPLAAGIRHPRSSVPLSTRTRSLDSTP
jgi:uncharacterized protein (TIGR02453 family)